MSVILLAAVVMSFDSITWRSSASGCDDDSGPARAAVPELHASEPPPPGPELLKYSPEQIEA
ncbi:MAG: hypothetical protein WCO86_16830, partial [Planctomycetota bacterium]